jgi:hypothetical protein
MEYAWLHCGVNSCIKVEELVILYLGAESECTRQVNVEIMLWMCPILLNWDADFMWFSGIVLQLGHDCFLPNHFEFISHPTMQYYQHEIHKI